LIAPRLSALVLAAGALAFAACGSDDDDSGDAGGSGTSADTAEQAPAPSKSEKTIDISEVDFKIEPATVQVAKPGTVTFAVSNDGQAPHALEVEGPGGEQETKELAAGQSAELTMDLSEEGTFEMYCPVGNHRQMGMEGEIVVGAGGGSASSDDSEDEGSDDDSGGGGGGGY